VQTSSTAIALGAALLAGFAFIAPVQAQGIHIAAVVDDQVISNGDFNARVGLVLASSNIPDDAETRARVGTQVMRQMIDEKLEMEEAKKEGVNLSDNDIKAQLAQLAHINHLQPEQLDGFLADHHIDKDALVSQITAQLLWGRTVQRRYGHTVSIGEDEINDAMKNIEAQRSKPSSHVEEIFLSVENPQQDAEVHQLADHLVEEMQHGARFSDVARQFSQSPTAAAGGDVGWVLPGMLDADLEQIIDGMQPGTMTRPIRLSGGYYIYLLLERHTPDSVDAHMTVDLTQVVFPLAADASSTARDAVIKKAKEATADTHSCGEIAKIGREISPDLSGPIGTVQVTDLPAEIRPIIQAADVAKPTDPVPVRGGIGVFMVCHKTGGAPKIDRDQVESQLHEQRLENISHRYLSDLRRVAYIDLRV